MSRVGMNERQVGGIRVGSLNFYSLVALKMIHIDTTNCR